MARTKKSPEIIIEHDSIDDNHQLAAAANEMTAHSAEIVNAYGHGVPYNREYYLDKARGHIMRSAEEALELGRCLIVMKEHEPHGEWINILETIGMDVRLSQRTMQVAIKFSNASTSTHLIEAAKSKSKIFELMVLDDSELEQLNEGKTVAGINLDAIEKMPVSELRKALREAKKDLQAKDDVAQENANRIKELQEKVARIKKQPADEVSAENRHEVTTLVNQIDHDLRVNLYDALVLTRDHDDANGIATQEFLKAQIEQLEAATALLRHHLIIGVEWEQN